jgi:ubiquitin-conjugating enzyme E2 J2
MSRQPSKLCKRRLAKEWRMLTKEPVPCVRAAPNENNILEWHFVILELDDDRYRGGFYHGVVVFPVGFNSIISETLGTLMSKHGRLFVR